MKKFVNILGLFLILGIAFSSCKEDPLYTEPTPTVKVTSIAVEGLTANILTLEKSKTHQIKIAFNPTNATDIKDYTFTYKSADAKIATVSATGLITAVAAGDVMVTVTPKNNAKLEKTFKVVIPENFVSVTSVTITGALDKVEVGKTIPLTTYVAVLPANASDKVVIYTSSDVTKATVSNTGVVTGVAPGEVTITIASNEKPAIKATHKVTVEGPAVIAVESVTVTGPGVADNKLELEVAKTAALTTSVLPATATNKEVTYTSSTPATATVSADGVITAVAEGTTTITVASKADATKKQEIVVTVKAPAVSNVNWLDDAARKLWVISKSQDETTKYDPVFGGRPQEVVDGDGATVIMLIKPGKGPYDGVTVPAREDGGRAYFDINFGADVSFDHIKVTHRTGDERVHWKEAKLWGSNTGGDDFVEIEASVIIPIPADKDASRESGDIKLSKTHKYKYLRVEMMDVSGTISTCQVAEFYVGLKK